MFITKYSTEYSSIKYGFYSSIALILVFLIFRILGMTGVIWLRVVDVLVLYFFTGKVLEYYRDHHSHITYFICLGLCLMTSVVAMVIFSVFMFLYTQFLSPDYMDYLRIHAPMGEHLNPYIILATLIIEGVAIGFIISMIKVNALKDIED